MFATKAPQDAAMISTSPELIPVPAAAAAAVWCASGFPASVIVPRVLPPRRHNASGAAPVQDGFGTAGVNRAAPHTSLTLRATIAGADVPSGLRMSVAADPPFTKRTREAGWEQRG